VFSREEAFSRDKMRFLERKRFFSRDKASSLEKTLLFGQSVLQMFSDGQWAAPHRADSSGFELQPLKRWPCLDNGSP
jgi:hypothetical protein